MCNVDLSDTDLEYIEWALMRHADIIEEYASWFDVGSTDYISLEAQKLYLRQIRQEISDYFVNKCDPNERLI